MKKSFTLLLVALFGYLAKSHACDCLYILTFCQTISLEANNQTHDGLHIYLGTVSAKTGNGITVLVEKTYFGDRNTGQNLNFISGADCVAILDNFQIGEQYIMAARKTTNDNWVLPVCGCGLYSLRVENGTVKGKIAPDVVTVPLADFTNMANCGDLTGGNEPDFPIKVNPTLTSNEVNITTELPSPVPIHVTVFDAAGRLVHQTTESAFDIDKTIVLNMEAWAAGVYFVRLDLLNQRKTVKVVKVGL